MKPVQCANCSRYEDGLTCQAFKKRIPAELLTGQADHTKPFKGDNGIIFEAIDDTDKS